MNYQIFTIYDRVATRYSELVLHPNQASAERWFNQVMEKSQFRPSDFDLIFLGSYDIETGEIVPLPKPLLVTSGIDPQVQEAK